MLSTTEEGLGSLGSVRIPSDTPTTLAKVGMTDV